MIVVTAGHVDHGKTALLQALTGTNTAHLPEEKKRGMTIDLGYAYLPLGEEYANKTLGFIDVPGHEKFLTNMLAGLGGIDYAMLIVAADEGVQAQTVEHLAILRLLQLTQIIVVMTKADRVDSAQIEQLKTTLRQDYPNLADSPCFVTSARTGEGIAALRDYLARLPNLADSNKPFRYAIDRVFTVKGAGTVVTGTALSGKVQIDDKLFLSSGETVRIKNIHAQNQPSNQGLAGQRLALNINADLAREQIERGDWLFSNPPIAPTERVTVLLQTEQPLNENQSVHIYYATNRTVAKLNLLTQKNAVKNQCVFCELILDKPLFLAYGDKLIVRSGDAKHLVGGARVLEIYSPKRHKRTPERLAYLTQLQHSQQPAERIALYLQDQAVNANFIAWVEQLSLAQLDALLATNQQVRFHDWCFNANYQQQQTEKLLQVLNDYHIAHPDQMGLGKARLYRIACLHQPEKLIFNFIEQLIAQGQLRQTRGWLHLPDHRIEFDEQEKSLWKQVLAQFIQQNGEAIWVRDMATVLAQDESVMRNFLYKAGKLGYLTAVVKDRFFLTEQIYAYASLVKKIIQQQGEISVNQLRDELNFGRKLTVQLLEYFDKCGFLRRKGNAHLLRDKEMFE